MSNPMFAMFKTNSNAEKKGTWINYGEFKFLVARAGGTNHAYKNLIEVLSKPYRRQIDAEKLDEAKQKEILAEAYSRTVILGAEVLVPVKGAVAKEGEEVQKEWVPGLFSESGEVLNPTPANIKKCLLELPDLFKDLQLIAVDSAAFLEEAQEKDAKN